MFKILLWIFVLGLIAFVASVFPRSMCTLTWMIFLPLVTAGFWEQGRRNEFI